MNLEALLEGMPDYIKDSEGRKYHLFIAKGTRKSETWTVGYSDYETEFTPPVTKVLLKDAIMQLRDDIEKKERSQNGNVG